MNKKLALRFGGGEQGECPVSCGSIEKNEIYPTYQLHAYMANTKTAPQYGLRLKRLITMGWFKQCLEEHVLEELLCLPEPSAHMEADDFSLLPEG